MEDIVRQGNLFDCYGALLTEHQKNIYQDAVFGDLSLGEIAENYGISRQGVHDLIKRVTKLLENYESNLGLVEKFRLIKDKSDELEQLLGELNCGLSENEEVKSKANRLLQEIRDAAVG